MEKISGAVRDRLAMVHRAIPVVGNATFHRRGVPTIVHSHSEFEQTFCERVNEKGL